MNRASFTQSDLKSLLQKHAPSSTHVQAPISTPEPVEQSLEHPLELLQQKEEKEIALLKEALRRIIDRLSHYKAAAILLAKRLAAQKPLEPPIENPLNAELKKRFLQLMTQKKELEAAVSSLSYEKAALLARLHELSQKAKHEIQGKDTSEKRLSAALDEIKELERRSCELQESKDALERAHAQDIAVTQACVIERQQAFTDERAAHSALIAEFELVKKEAESNRSRLQLAQQHLARRIKECVLLEKQCQAEVNRAAALQASLNSEIQKSGRLESSLEALGKNEEELRQELLMRSTLHEEKMTNLQDKLSDLMRQTYAQKDALEVMHRQKARLQQLEELYAKFGQIVTPEPALFSQITKDIPFEYHER